MASARSAASYLSTRLHAYLRALFDDPWRLALITLALLYVVIFTQMAWATHAGMRTHKADLGQIDQAIWNSSRGRLLAQTDNGFEATRLTDHVEPILVLISPIYWLWDDVRAVLLLQVVAVAIGVLPLYALAMRQFETFLSARERTHVWLLEPLYQLARPLAFALGLAYLLAPQLQSAVLTEFHAAPLAVPMILWAFWAVSARRWGQAGVAVLLVALVKEEIALLAAGLGVWGMWRAWWDGRVVPNGANGVDAGKAAGVRRSTQQSKRKTRREKNRRLSRAPAPRARWYGLNATRAGFVMGAGTALLALGWFLAATFVIVPAHAADLYGAAESTYFQRYGALGDSSASILRSMVTQPGLVWQIATEAPRLAYLVGLFVAFAWFSLLGAEILLLALPVLLANQLSAYPAQYYGEFHYSAPLVPYFAVAAAYGLPRLWRWVNRSIMDQASPAFQHLPAAGTGTMALVSMVQNARTALRPILATLLLVWTLGWSVANYLEHGRGPLAARYDPTPVTAHGRLLDEFVAQLPPDAAVTATAAVHPHVSHRRYVYQFPMGLDAPVPADWALLDATTNTDMAPGDLKNTVDEMLSGDWGVVDAADGFLLLRKGAPAHSIPDDFYGFTRRAPGRPLPTPLATDDVAAVDWPRWRETRLSATYRIGAGFDPRVHAPQLEVVTPALETVSTLDSTTPPALVWYPPDRWQEGETIRVTTLPLYLPRTVAVLSGAAGAPTAIFRRTQHDRLVQLPAALAEAADLPAALQPALLAPLEGTAGRFALTGGETLAVQGWLESRRSWPGDTVDLWLQWRGAAWPANFVPFVHLREDDANVAQMDGPPRFFTLYDANTVLAAAGYANDWRQFAIPADARAGATWSVVVGLYDPATGQRLSLVDAQGQPVGDELVIGPVRVAAPPVPDQACALIPATCAAQAP